MHVIVLAGRVERLQPSRTFTDGQLLPELTVLGDNGGRQQILNVFCPNRLLEPFHSPEPKQIYVWRRHVFAIRQGGQLIEDVRGVTRSYLTRDLAALGLMTASIVLAPYALWVVIKKLYGLLSISEMKSAIGNA